MNLWAEIRHFLSTWVLIVSCMVSTLMDNDLVKGTDYTGVAVVYFCHDGKGKFVMGLRGKNARDEQGRWDIGAGGLEFGDTVENTLRKEIKEEYCSEVRDYKFIGYRDVHRENNGQKTHWIVLDFTVLVDPTMIAVGEPHKFDKVDWFALDTLPNNLHSQLLTFLEKYKDVLP